MESEVITKTADTENSSSISEKIIPDTLPISIPEQPKTQCLRYWDEQQLLKKDENKDANGEIDIKKVHEEDYSKVLNA
jgi:hypothetical protein